MRVYVIRHGESETNKAKKWTGWLDVHLTDKGKDDAKKAGNFLKGNSFDKIYSSDLVRARETAEIVIPGCQYEISELLREINVGSLEGKQFSDLTEEQKSDIAKNSYIAFGGESKKDFSDRVTGFMKKLEGINCDNIVVFSYAGWLRKMLDIVIGTYIPRAQVCCNNCTVAIFEYTGEMWRLHSWVNMI